MIDANCRLIADSIETVLKVLDLQHKLEAHYKRDFNFDDVINMAIDYLNNKLDIE